MKILYTIYPISLLFLLFSCGGGAKTNKTADDESLPQRLQELPQVYYPRS